MRASIVSIFPQHESADDDDDALAPSTPSSRTLKKKRQLRLFQADTHTHTLTATLPWKDTYPKYEGIDDEQGFQAGDDRFGFHCAAGVRAAANGERRGKSVCAGVCGERGEEGGEQPQRVTERLRSTLRDDPRRRSGSLPSFPDLEKSATAGFLHV